MQETVKAQLGARTEGEFGISQLVAQRFFERPAKDFQRFSLPKVGHGFLSFGPRVPNARHRFKRGEHLPGPRVRHFWAKNKREDLPGLLVPLAPASIHNSLN